MRADYQRVATDLERALHGLLSAPRDHPGQFEGHLFDFTHVLFHNPLANAALETVLAMRRRNLQAVREQCRTWLTDVLVPELIELDRDVEGLCSQLNALPPEAEPRRKLRAALALQLPFGSVELALERLLADLRSPERVQQLTFEEMRSLHRNTVGNLGHISAVVAIANQDNTTFNSRIERIERALQLGLKHLDFVEGLVQAATLEPLVGLLRRADERIEAILLARESVPVEDDALTRLRVFDDNWLLGAIHRITMLVVAQLGLGPVRHQVIVRLRAYFEHFGREILLERVAAMRSSRKVETIVQEAVDHFAFQEGVFPVTHAVAGRGRIDTFLDADRAQVLDGIGETRQIPLLLELKQAIAVGSASSTSKRDVRAAVEDARVQAEEYAKHLRAHPRWKDQEVFALVFYDGPKRYCATDADIVLVYLGDQRPSEGADDLFK